MIILQELVISLSLVNGSQSFEDNRFAQAIPYSSFSIEQPKFKDTMNYNTMTNEELIRENNEKIIQQIYKTLE